MDFLILANSNLGRLGNRLTYVLRSAYDAEMWDDIRFANQASSLPTSTRIITVGEVWHANTLINSVEEPGGLPRLGACWAWRRNKAACWATKRDKDGRASFDALQRASDRIQSEATEAVAAGVGDNAGAKLASLHLSPDFQIPVETVRGMMTFDMDGMLWERRHTIAVAHFLLHGFDDFVG